MSSFFELFWRRARWLMYPPLTLNVSFDDLLKEAGPIPAGSKGLLVLPYLSGKRTSRPDPLACSSA